MSVGGEVYESEETIDLTFKIDSFPGMQAWYSAENTGSPSRMERQFLVGSIYQVMVGIWVLLQEIQGFLVLHSRVSP